jgi:hypothetical protein
MSDNLMRQCVVVGVSYYFCGRVQIFTVVTPFVFGSPLFTRAFSLFPCAARALTDVAILKNFPKE